MLSIMSMYFISFNSTFVPNVQGKNYYSNFADEEAKIQTQNEVFLPFKAMFLTMMLYKEMGDICGPLSSF